MNTKWPRVADHDMVSCFNCGGDLTGEYWHASGYAPGRGEFVQDCRKCGERTYYDLSETAR